MPWHETTTNQWLRAAGLKRQHKRRLNTERDTIILQAAREGQLLREIGSRLGISREAARRQLKRKGLTQVRLDAKEGLRQLRVQPKSAVCRWCQQEFVRGSQGSPYVYCSIEHKMEQKKKWSRDYNRAYYHTEKGKAYAKLYQQTPGHKAYQRKYRRESYQRKRTARRAANVQ